MASGNGEKLRIPTAELYTERVDRELEAIVVQLRQCGTYDQLPQTLRTTLYHLVSGGVDEVMQCDTVAREGVAVKLREIQSILEKDNSGSYILKMLVLPHLKKMVEGLGQ